ncbi:MAG: 5-(carboxyamino)imidazole ribonucleotide mutase [Thermotogaceae bacterium]|nr:5-(carboxyamino)imidazole ribonucleotide mutase [Thermotogaceae bacterium]
MRKVMIVMGSDSDLDVMNKAKEVLEEFGVEYELRILSAHRTPKQLMEAVSNLEKNGFEIVIAGAGAAAHLPGVIAALTVLPVIGVPVKSDFNDGLDSLLSIVQMPNGIPVATVGVNRSKNAALLAIQMLSLKYEDLKEKLLEYRKNMEASVIEKDKKLRGK